MEEKSYQIMKSHPKWPHWNETERNFVREVCAKLDEVIKEVNNFEWDPTHGEEREELWDAAMWINNWDDPPITVQILEHCISNSDPDSRMIIIFVIDVLLTHHVYFQDEIEVNLPEVFCNVFKVVDQKRRIELFKMRSAWSKTESVSSEVLLDLDTRVKAIDDKWPIFSAPNAKPSKSLTTLATTSAKPDFLTVKPPASEIKTKKDLTDIKVQPASAELKKMHQPVRDQDKETKVLPVQSQPTKEKIRATKQVCSSLKSCGSVRSRFVALSLKPITWLP